jgi:hypothetical protein
MDHARLSALYIFGFSCTAFILVQVFGWDFNTNMRSVIPLVFSATVVAQNATVDLNWHAPNKTWINNLSQVLNGTGTNGFVFNSSQLPAGTKYGTYNWCNMPHVRKQEYVKASEEYQLAYVEV